MTRYPVFLSWLAGTALVGLASAYGAAGMQPAATFWVDGEPRAGGVARLHLTNSTIGRGAA